MAKNTASGESSKAAIAAEGMLNLIGKAKAAGLEKMKQGGQEGLEASKVAGSADADINNLTRIKKRFESGFYNV